MTVFKCALKIIRGHIAVPLIYIVGLSFMGIFMAMSLDVSDENAEFSMEQADVAIVDRDASAISSDISSLVSGLGNPVFLDDDIEGMQDAIAKGKVDYLLIVPKGFGEDFIEAVQQRKPIPELEAVYGTSSRRAVYADQRVNEYLGLLQSELLAGGEWSIEEASDLALKAAEEDVDVNVMHVGASTAGSDKFIFFLKWSTYTLFAGIISCVGMLTVSMGRAGVRRRNLASPMRYASYYFQVALSCLLIAVLAWIWTFTLGLVVFPEALEQISLPNLALCALSVLAYALIPLSVGFLLGQLGASFIMCNAIGNIVGMVISFFGGAWISLELLSPEVVAFSRWLPGYWYTEACGKAFMLDGNGANTGDVLIDIGVLALYAVAVLSVAFLAGRLRLQTTSSSGSGS